ncbi:sulfonate ABC transporter substrate-binding protein, partial [Rhizobium ruizarguesonis]
MKITRRAFTALVAGAIATPLTHVRPAGAAEKVVRIGYQ